MFPIQNFINNNLQCDKCGIDIFNDNIDEIICPCCNKKYIKQKCEKCSLKSFYDLCIVHNVDNNDIDLNFNFILKLLSQIHVKNGCIDINRDNDSRDTDISRDRDRDRDLNIMENKENGSDIKCCGTKKTGNKEKCTRNGKYCVDGQYYCGFHKPK